MTAPGHVALVAGHRTDPSEEGASLRLSGVLPTARPLTRTALTEVANCAPHLSEPKRSNQAFEVGAAVEAE